MLFLSYWTNYNRSRSFWGAWENIIVKIGVGSTSKFKTWKRLLEYFRTSYLLVGVWNSAYFDLESFRVDLSCAVMAASRQIGHWQWGSSQFSHGTLIEGVRAWQDIIVIFECRACAGFLVNKIRSGASFLV